MAESNSNVIDFRDRSLQEKIQLVLEIITKLTNFNPEYPTYDLSTATLPLHVSNMLFLSFIHSLNWDVVSSQLTGLKTPNEVLEIIVNPYGE